MDYCVHPPSCLLVMNFLLILFLPFPFPSLLLHTCHILYIYTARAGSTPSLTRAARPKRPSTTAGWRTTLTSLASICTFRGTVREAGQAERGSSRESVQNDIYIHVCLSVCWPIVCRSPVRALLSRPKPNGEARAGKKIDSCVAMSVTAVELELDCIQLQVVGGTHELHDFVNPGAPIYIVDGAAGEHCVTFIHAFEKKKRSHCFRGRLRRSLTPQNFMANTHCVCPIS